MKKISTKLLIIFLLVSAIPMCIVGGLSYWLTANQLQNLILERLETLSLERANRIEGMFTEKLVDVQLMSTLPFIQTALDEFDRSFSQGGINSSEYLKTEKRLTPLIINFTSRSQCYDILLINPTGDVVFSLVKQRDLSTNLLTGRYQKSILATTFSKVLLQQKGVISSIGIYEPSRGPAIFLAAPIWSNQRLVGVLAFQVSLEQMHATVGDFTGLGKTGETVLVTVQEGEIVWVSPVRHDPGAAFTRKIPVVSPDTLPARLATTGSSGRGIYPDYRGVLSLAAWRYIPSMNLGLVIKMDKEEAIAPVHRFTTWFFLSGLCSLLIVFFVSIYISRTITSPIKALTRATEGMLAGDLTVRADLDINDEIGVLGQTFDTMIARLQSSQAESENQVWLKAGIGRMNKVVSGDPDIDILVSSGLDEIATYLGARVGALYLLQRSEDSSLHFMAGYAFPKEKQRRTVFKIGEGLVGQVARDKKQLIINEISEDYLKIISALGEKRPDSICIAPILFEQRLKGVVELGTLGEFTELQLEYLEQAISVMAIAVEASEGRSELQKSLDNSQALTEELQVQQEELEASNEELETQTLHLKASEEKLKAQQEELQVTNEELEEKNELLERQKREVVKGQQLLDQKVKELALASKYKSEFLANMSHELRTPLNSLLLLSQSLSQNRDGNLLPSQVEALTVIYGSGKDLLNLINEILDLSKIEAGRMQLEISQVRLEDIATSLRSSFNHIARQRGLTLEITLDDALPEEIVSDQKRIEQIIRNLLSNALKFTHTGGVSVSFCRGDTRMSKKQVKQAVEQLIAIKVKDSGIGIAPDGLEVIFEAFRQADGSTSRKYGGTGLGLSISREIARLLGGEILVESEPGKGSTFTLVVPEFIDANDLGEKRPTEDQCEQITRVADPVPPALPSLSPTSLSPSPAFVTDDREQIVAGDIVILVIEDDPKFAQILYNNCHERGLKCLLAPSGELGLELVNRYKPLGIILDIRLPGMDGWSVLAVLKDNIGTRHIPVYIVSIDETTTDALKKGAIGQVSKPVNLQELNEVFQKIEGPLQKKIKHVLLVDGDPKSRTELVGLLAGEDVHVDEAPSEKEAVAFLKQTEYDCVVLDIGPSIEGGISILQTAESEGIMLPPVIIHTANDLSYEEEMTLRDYTETIVIKNVLSQERLLDEVSLFLHRTVGNMSETKRQIIRDLHENDALFQDKKVLIVDDDMRTVFVLARLLTERGLKTLKADNGETALKLLDKEPDVNLILMDIMMPIMDGYETIAKIRKQERFRKLPIIALTAKAMRDDREKCIQAGANDYLSKPLDQERLLSLLRVWLYR